MPHRFTVAEYRQMGTGGVFSEHARVELIDGEVVEMTPIGARHAACVSRLTRLLVMALGDRAVVSPQNPVQVGNWSEPEPDLAVLRPRADFYAERLGEPADVLLLIEVADTSGAYDRSVKVPLYLDAGVPEIWVVDVAGGVVDVFSAAGRFRRGPGDTIVPVAIPDLVVDVAAILG